MAKDLRNILLSEIEENKIKEKTPDKLPLNPTAEGWSGHEVRRFLAKSLIDNEGSFLAVFKEKMIEIKAHFEDIHGHGDEGIQGQIDSIFQDFASIENYISQLQTGKQNKLTAGRNVTIDQETNVISSLGGSGVVISVTEPVNSDSEMWVKLTGEEIIIK